MRKQFSKMHKRITYANTHTVMATIFLWLAMMLTISCDAASNPSGFVGRWIGVSDLDKGSTMEFLSDGTGILVGKSGSTAIKWKTENNRLYITAEGSARAKSAGYKLQGSMLTLTEDNGKISEYTKCNKDCQKAAKEYAEAKKAEQTASSGVDKQLEDFKKSQRCGDETCPEYRGSEFLQCLNRVGSDCEKKFANEKKDKYDKGILCTIEGGKKCKKTIDEALVDSGEVEKIPGIKNLFSILDSMNKLEEEKKKINIDRDIMESKKEKQLELLKQKEEKLNKELTEIIQKQILNATITLKGISIYDFYPNTYWRGRYLRNLEGTKEIKEAASVIQCQKGKIDECDCHIGRYDKNPFKVLIFVDEKFAQKTDRGVYDITGTIIDFDFNDFGSIRSPRYEYGYPGIILPILLKSAKYIGEK